VATWVAPGAGTVGLVVVVLRDDDVVVVVVVSELVVEGLAVVDVVGALVVGAGVGAGLVVTGWCPVPAGSEEQPTSEAHKRAAPRSLHVPKLAIRAPAQRRCWFRNLSGVLGCEEWFLVSAVTYLVLGQENFWSWTPSVVPNNNLDHHGVVAAKLTENLNGGGMKLRVAGLRVTASPSDLALSAVVSAPVAAVVETGICQYAVILVGFPSKKPESPVVVYAEAIEFVVTTVGV